MHRIAFTGHRSFAGTDRDDVLVGLKRLVNSLDRRVTISTGGAVGLDTDAFEVTSLSDKVDSILHIPFEYQYDELLRVSHNLEGYNNVVRCRQCMSGMKRPLTPADNRFYQLRNEHMVDTSDIVYCYWNGEEQGGTWNTVRYARKVGKPVVDIRELLC